MNNEKNILEVFKATLVGELRDNTIKSYEFDLKGLQAYAGDLITVKPMDIKLYRTKLLEDGVSPFSLNRMLSTFRKFYGFLLDNDYIKENPTKSIKSLKTSSVEQTQEFLTSEEVEKFIGAIKNQEATKRYKEYTMRRDLLFFVLQLSTALRVENMIDLTFQQVDFEKCEMNLVTKGGVKRVIPFPRTLLPLFDEYMEARKSDSEYVFLTTRGNKMSTMDINNQMKKYGAQAGINKNLSSHCCRRTRATMLANDGFKLHELRDFMGHSSTLVTSRYLKSTNDKQRELTDACPIF